MVKGKPKQNLVGDAEDRKLQFEFLKINHILSYLCSFYQIRGEKISINWLVANISGSAASSGRPYSSLLGFSLCVHVGFTHSMCVCVDVCVCMRS